MEYQDYQDKMVCQDLKVIAVWMGLLVLLVSLEPVYLEILDLKENQA